MFYPDYDYDSSVHASISIEGFKKNLSYELKVLRRANNITHHQLSMLTGFSRSTISRIENNSGSYSLEKALLILHVLAMHNNVLINSPICTTILPLLPRHI